MNKYLILLVLLMCSVSAYSQEGLEVVSSVIPPRQLTAQAVGASGQVDILITIDGEGNVMSADAFNGHPLLRSTSRPALMKWKFNKTADSALRTASITFVFNPDGLTKIVETSEKEVDVTSSANFVTPFWAEITTTNIYPKLLLLPREKGEIKPAMCDLHKERMAVEILRTPYEPDPGDDLENYVEDMEKDFPNIRMFFRGGFPHSVERVQIHYCKTCRLKREQWISEHINN